MSESRVAAACRRVREARALIAAYPDGETPCTCDGDDGDANCPVTQYTKATNLLGDLGATALDLLCGEGGALLALEAVVEEMDCRCMGDPPGPDGEGYVCIVCLIPSILRRAAEELGGGGS